MSYYNLPIELRGEIFQQSTPKVRQSLITTEKSLADWSRNNETWYQLLNKDFFLVKL